MTKKRGKIKSGQKEKVISDRRGCRKGENKGNWKNKFLQKKGWQKKSRKKQQNKRLKSKNVKKRRKKVTKTSAKKEDKGNKKIWKQGKGTKKGNKIDQKRG